MLSKKKLYLLTFAILLGSLGIFPLCLPKQEEAAADTVFSVDEEQASDVQISDLQIVAGTTLLPFASPPFYEESDVVKEVKVIVTAYSSSVWETQGDPFITASGSRVRDGIVANNLLGFGTKIRLPEIFDDKIFVVEDRMHWRKGDFHVDIWFASTEEALEFGSKYATMEVLAN